jgi:hypothetical protein
MSKKESKQVWKQVAMVQPLVPVKAETKSDITGRLNEKTSNQPVQS